MKNLVVSTLFAAAAVSLAGGCIFVSDDDPPIGGLGDIDISWSLKSTDQAGNTIAANCPVGADTATLFALPEGAPPASAFSDKYDCIDGGGTIADLEPGRYIVWVRLSDFNGTTRFAESGSQVIDVFENNVATAPYNIYVDRAFFLVGWDLRAPGGSSPSCGQVVGEDGVAISATDGGGGLFEVVVDCEEGDGVQTISEPIPSRLDGTARYTVVTSLLNAAGESIGDSVGVTRTLDYGNELEDLGIVPINLR
jgi:hypothetical protein